MKLHLPKRLLAAVMALFTLGIGTTLGADVVSINFGADKRAVSPDATGSLNGVGAANWNNISGSETTAVVYNLLGYSGVTYTNLMTLTCAQANWQNDVSGDVNTLVFDMQRGYLDLSANNSWTITLNFPTAGIDTEYTTADLVMYFAGDGNKYSPVNVGGTAYIGGTNVSAGEATEWGDRSSSASESVGTDKNTITVTGINLSAPLQIQNVPQNDANKRATISGMQILLTELYNEAELTGSVVAENVVWTAPNGTKTGKYTDFAAGKRRMGAILTGDTTLTFANGAAIDVLHAEGAYTMTLDSAGDVGIGRIDVASGSQVQMGDILADTATLWKTGEGALTLTKTQTLAALQGNGALHIADDVVVTVGAYHYIGNISAGSGAELNIDLTDGAAKTWNGMTLTQVSGTGFINALETTQTEVNVSNGASFGLSSAGGTLLVKGETGTRATLASLALMPDSTTTLKAADGVMLSGTLEKIRMDQGLVVGSGVHLIVTGDDVRNVDSNGQTAAGFYALSLGNGTLTIDGGRVDAESFIAGDRGDDKKSYVVIANSGLLNITGEVDCMDGGIGAALGKNGSVRLCHWSSEAQLDISSGGEFRVLGAAINVGDDGKKTTINVNNGGILNAKGFVRFKDHTEFKVDVAAGGVFNLGESGINITSDQTVTISVAGTIGALSDQGWACTNPLRLQDEATVQLAVWDVEKKQYTNTAANIDLTAGISGSGSLTLAGNGCLTVSSALAHDVKKAEGAGATLAIIFGFDRYAYEAAGTYIGYGESTTDGYQTSVAYTVAGAGSTLDKVTLIDGDTQTEYALTGGKIHVADEPLFFVNTEVQRNKITDYREGTVFDLAEKSVYHTHVTDDLGAIVQVYEGASVYLQNVDGTKDLLLLTNVPAATKPNLTIEGNTVTGADTTYTADITVLRGVTLKQNGADTVGAAMYNTAGASRVITLQENAVFELNGYDAYYHLVLEKGAKISNSGGVIDYWKRSLPIVELKGDATVHTDSRFGILGDGYDNTMLELNGNTLTKTGSGIFHFNNCTTDAGTIRIENGKVLVLEFNGNEYSDTSATTFAVVGKEADGQMVRGVLEFGKEGRSVGAISALEAEGGIVRVNSDRVVTVQDAVTGAGFTKVGEGALAFASGMKIKDDLTINFETLTENEKVLGAGSITLSALSVEAGKTLDIQGSVVADGLCKTGEGLLTINALSGVLSYAVAHDATLAIESLEGDTIIDVLGVANLSSGVALGIKDTQANREKIRVACVEDGTWTLEADAMGYLTLKAAENSTLEIKTDWDLNWGAAELDTAPATVTGQEAGTGVVALALAPVQITGGGDADTLLVGGKSFTTLLDENSNIASSDVSENVAGDTWIKVSGGTFGKIVGGNACNNWGSTGPANFTGDSHILMEGGTAQYVIGGNLNDAHGAVFKGDTYVSIMRDAVVGHSVVGGSTMSHTSGMTLTGDTHVYVYIPLGGEGFVLGGHMYLANYKGNMVQNGSTEVTVDLSGYSIPADKETVKFEKHVVGASYLNSDTHGDGGDGSNLLVTSTVNGDTHVTIVGKENVLFNGVIAGASFVDKTNENSQKIARLIGTSHVNISGGSVFENVVAGGTVFNSIAGTSSAKRPASDVKGTDITISGGTFKEKVVGGDAMIAEAIYESTVGTVTMAISGGTYQHHIIGGTYKGGHGGDAQIIKVGDVTLALSGGSMDAGSMVVGGSYLSGTGEGALGKAGNVSMGDISVTVTGGTWQNILGGTYVERDKEPHYMSQGDIVVDLVGGSIAGNVYAAGQQVNRSYLTTESTTVKLHSAVTLSGATPVISGGYDTTKTTSIVTGERTLVFTGDTQDRSGVIFKDFDVINVATAGKTATVGALDMADALTVGGEGTLKLNANSSVAGGMTVAGALDVGGCTVTGDVTVTGGLSGGGTVVGDLDITAAEKVSGALSATNILVAAYTNADGMTATESISVGTALTSAANITAGKVSGAGTVTITGGTVTLSDSTDAFANTGATTISGADLAGKWNADGVTIGENTTVSGTVGLADSAVNATIEAIGTVNLSGEITVGVAGQQGVTLYTHGENTSASGNGFRSGITTYAIVSGGSSTADGVVWKGVTNGTLSFADGTLTSATDRDTSTYWVNTDTVSYDGSNMSSGGVAEALGTAGISLNGGTLQLDTSVAAAGLITVTAKNGIIDMKNGQMLNQNALSGDGTATITGAGTYAMGAATDLGVALGDAWTGKVTLDSLAGGDLSAYTTAGSTVEVGSITAAGLTLAQGNLNITDSLTLTAVAADSISIAGTLGGEFDVLIDDTLFASVIAQGQSSGSITLGAIGSAAADLAMTLNGGDKYDLGESSYTLGVSADGKSIVLSGTVLGCEWNGAADAVWTDTQDAPWTGGSPNGGENANFLGKGTNAVVVSGTVTPGHLRADSDYTLNGDAADGADSIEASGRLNVAGGTLTLNVAASFGGDNKPQDAADNALAASEVAAAGKLVVGSAVTINGGLNNLGSTTVGTGASLALTNGGLLNKGTFVVDGGAVTIGSPVASVAEEEVVDGFKNTTAYTVQNGGMTTVYGKAENSGTLTVNDGTFTVVGDMDSTGGTLDLQKGNLNVSGALSGVDFATIASGVNVSVGSYTDTTGVSIDGKLTITGQSSVSAVSLGAGTLVVDGGTLTTGELVFGTLANGNTAQASVANGGSLVGAAGKIRVTPGNTADSLAADDVFRLVSGVADASGYGLSADYEQTVLKRQLKAELLTDADGLYLGVRAQTEDELTWKTSGDASVGGLTIMNGNTLADGYASLDTIKHVVVDADRVMNLRYMTPADADGLNINDLSGDKKLSLEGNGDDVVTITGGAMEGELSIMNTTVKASGLTVGTLTGVPYYSVMEGASVDNYVVGGDITVTKKASLKSGLYDGATIGVTNGAVADLAVGTGLSVSGDAGSINLLYDKPAAMDAIKTTGADVYLKGAPGNSLTMADESAMVGGSLNFDVDVENFGASIIDGALTLQGTAVNVGEVNPNGISKLDVGAGTITLAVLGDTEADAATSINLVGDLIGKYFTNARIEDGKLVADRNTSYVSESVHSTSTNGTAGVALLEDGFLNLNPQVKNPDGDLAAILNAVDAGLVTDEHAAAVAGSSTTALGMAFAGDVERQLRAIRNRTTTMGVNPCVVNEGMPYFNAWINAEGNRGELDKDGTMPGYTLDSWGGTVGFDVDVNPGLTLGMAVTAMYGDLTTDGPDTLEGDMDTYYVSAFARYSKRGWSHTFVATVGKMDTTYERTVNHAGGSYMAEGDTDGTAFGLMYEVARSYTLDYEGNVGGQLVANVAYRHTTVGGYEETGRDAALKVDDQTLDTITFGVGGRMQAVVGENLFNRTSVFEARALAKFDVGDRSSEADVAFLGGSRSATVESAELGAFGVELGAGFSIPVGNVNDGTIFFDVSAELRSGYTNVNGTVGYRINF